ncbi:MAG: nascent polypeptide-associated complex protein [Nitrososphaeria archaeon]|nr:nascent polypeptide-associated complex protein [Aigarchaeota archaeon]MCX8187258.1 nascent polypeptide-associated complex protein [Nitrososphaeria archaeon]MDW8021945.1 nascent polypeptide-associated complex protein [Nitrososphaerota archaeon]
MTVRKISPRQLRRMQARMLGNVGLNLKELGTAEEVVIRLQDKELVLRNPSVVEMKIEGESIYQIIGGEPEERTPKVVEERTYEPSQEDVALVAVQAGVSEDEARGALVEAGGDLAKAILLLKSRKA